MRRPHLTRADAPDPAWVPAPDVDRRQGGSAPTVPHPRISALRPTTTDEGDNDAAVCQRHHTRAPPTPDSRTTTTTTRGCTRRTSLACSVVTLDDNVKGDDDEDDCVLFCSLAHGVYLTFAGAGTPNLPSPMGLAYTRT